MSTLFKEVFNSLSITQMGAAIFHTWSKFDQGTFFALATHDLSALEMKARSNQIVSALTLTLPDDFTHAAHILQQWTRDPDKHVRRLVSEGSRPRLPWGIRLQGLVLDPSPTLALLESLKNDPEDYVRLSVANHLNDIAKDHPALVNNLVTDWLNEVAMGDESAT